MTNENVLKPIPPAFILLMLMIFILPMIAFHYFGIDFNALTSELQLDKSIKSFPLEIQIQQYTRIAILQWATFSISTLIVLLALIEFYMTHAKILLVIAASQIAIAIFFITMPISYYHYTQSIGYFLKLTIYFLPFISLLIHSIFTYNAMIEKHTKLRIQQKKLQYIATHDSLTGLYNRQNFVDLLEMAINKSAETNHYFALFIIDIDNFKPINDTLGHLQGDIFLKKFALQLASLTRQGDIFSRFGGDEFSLLTTDLKSADIAKIIAERIIQGQQLPYPLNNKNLTTISMGIAIYPFDGTTCADLLKSADIAMYKAKKAGKNTYQFHSVNYELNS